MDPHAGQRPRGLSRNTFLTGVAFGLFIVGLVTALLVVPEWKVRYLGKEEAYESHFRAAVKDLKLFTLLPEAPRVDLISFDRDLPTIYQKLEKNAPTWLLSEGRPFLVGVSQSATDSLSRRGRLFILMSTNFRIWYIDWAASDLTLSAIARDPARYEPMAQALLRAGEQKVNSPSGIVDEMGNLLSVYSVSPSDPPQFILTQFVDVYVNAFRQSARTEEEAWDNHQHSIRHIFTRLLPQIVVLFVALSVIFVVYRKRRHIFSWRKALLFSGLALTSTLLLMNAVILSFIHFLDFSALSVYRTVLIFILWSAAESLLLGGSVGAVPRLSGLLNWRFTPQGGSQILTGVTLGVAAAGIHLLLESLTILMPGVYPTELSIPLQSVMFDQNPFYEAILLVSLVILADAFSKIKTEQGPEISFAIGTALGSVLLWTSYSPRGPWIFALVSTLPIAAILLVSFRRLGIAGVVSTSMTLILLPLSTFAALHWGWLHLTFSTTAGILIGLLAAGMWALTRSKKNGPVKLFLSYAHEDRDKAEELKEALQGLEDLSFWWDREIQLSSDYNEVIAKELGQADLFVVLVSDSLLRSSYCRGIELRKAIKRNRTGQLRVVPIFVDNCPWEGLIDLPNIHGVELLSEGWEKLRVKIEGVVRELRQERELSQRPIWMESLIS